MKKFLIVLCALTMLVAAACTPTPSGTVTPTGSTEPNGSAEPTGALASAADLYKNGYTNNMVVGVDEFGRTFDITAGDKADKEVGMFYWVWMGQPYATDIYDAAKIIAEYGKSTVFYETSEISPDGQAHWWGEPLWGYYNSADEFVIRKQIELLTHAGVDFIAFDATNRVLYPAAYMKVAKVISEFIAEGWNPPRLAFYTHSRSMETCEALYDSFYSKNKYPETWYMVDGKPMIIAYTEPWRDIIEARSRNDNDYAPEEYSQEIADFFTFKMPNWPGDDYNPKGFPWIEWKYPQPLHGDMMSVSVASHPRVPMSYSLTHENWGNWGRGYNVETKQNVAEDVTRGTFFQSQWETVFNNDPNTVFVGGWNEWIAYKQMYGGEYMLCDAADMEYSRDIEMMKGGYNDAFYIQLIMNMRKFKGTTPQTVSALAKTIDINGDVSQWDNVDAVYRDVGAENYDRSAYGAARTVRYEQDEARNNLQVVKVTRDEQNIYFYIESDKDITADDGKGNWMNIFLTAGSPKNTGWVCYDYIINKNNGSVEKLNADFTSQKVGDASVKVSGKYMQVAVSRSLIGLTESSEFYFKVADGVEHPEDIMDYYVTGRSLPMGRLSYKYNG